MSTISIPFPGVIHNSTAPYSNQKNQYRPSKPTKSCSRRRSKPALRRPRLDSRKNSPVDSRPGYNSPGKPATRRRLRKRRGEKGNVSLPSRVPRVHGSTYSSSLTLSLTRSMQWQLTTSVEIVTPAEVDRAKELLVAPTRMQRTKNPTAQGPPAHHLGRPALGASENPHCRESPRDNATKERLSTMMPRH